MQYLIRLKSYIIIILCFCTHISFAQLGSIDHWETVVFEGDTWDYFVGDSAPPTNWNQPAFMPITWLSGAGGIGYGDGDDNTIIGNTLSLYMRLDFNIIDTALITAAILNADYDDAFVAYLNGNEIARSNIGTVGIQPNYTDTANIYKEANMYLGNKPESFLLLKSDLNQYLNEGNNTLAIQVHNYTLSSSDMSARFFFSVGINDATTSYNPVPTWFITPFIATNLPIMKINTNGQSINSDTKITARMEIINNGSLNYLDDMPNDYDGYIGIEIRGRSSSTFAKKSFGVETRDSLGDNLNISLLGMPAENDWVLHGPYADKSLLRNFLSYHIGSSLNGYAPRVRFCEVFLDDQYWGVYVLTEKIKRDGNRVDIAKLNPTDTLGDELTGGYIFKIDWEDGAENGWTSPYGYGYYAYHSPKSAELHPSQKAYISNYFTSFENMMAGPNFDDPLVGYRNWIDVPSFIDYMMMQEISRNIDAYRLSAFMYKDKDSDGGKIYGGPMWDFNLGYGNEDFCDSGLPNTWAFQYNQTCGSPFPFFWSKLVNDPSFRNDFNCRWQELRTDVLNTDTILHFIDSMSIILNDAQIRNFERWNILGTYVWPNAYIGQDYAEEVQYLKTWITQRLGWMDNFMIGNGTNCTTATNEQFESVNIKVYPNPFTDYISIETDKYQTFTFELFDILGRNVITFIMKESETFHQLNMQDLEAGVYFYTLKKEGQITTKGKLIKQ